MYQLSQLDVLEAEAIFIMREVVAEFEKPVLLFSGGKDSIVMLRVAQKAFWPARIPFVTFFSIVSATRLTCVKPSPPVLVGEGDRVTGGGAAATCRTCAAVCRLPRPPPFSRKVPALGPTRGTTPSVRHNRMGQP